MASLSGVSSSNSLSSLMNSANMISGLASGMDTEGMIESLVQSYQTKINQFNQKITKLEWKQDAYRSIISKMYTFSSKYTSYTSSTNLMSPSFFSSAVKVAALGKYASSVSASGRTNSDISLNAVHQMAKAAQYRTKSKLDSGNDPKTISGKKIDLFSDDKQFELSNLSGGLALTYGSKTVNISFNETSDVETMKDIRDKLTSDHERDGITTPVTDEEVLAELINQKLADQQITFSSGNTESADKRIRAKATRDEDGNNTIVFEEIGSGKNGVYISGASGNIATQLGLDENDLADAKETKPVTLRLSNIVDPDGGNALTRKLNGIEYLNEKSNWNTGGTMNINLDGTTKQIKLPSVKIVREMVEPDEEEEGAEPKYVTKYYLDGTEIKLDENDDPNDENALAKKFTQKYTELLNESLYDAFKDKVRVENKATDGSLELEFTMKNEGSTLSINSSVGNALGIGNNATSYLNTSKTLGELLGEDRLGALTPTGEKDVNGNNMYAFEINGVRVGSYTKNSTLADIMNDINTNERAGVKVSYSQTTQSFTFTSKETGAGSEVKLGDGLAKEMFGVSGSKNDTASDAFKGVNWEEGGHQITFGISGDYGAGFWSFKVTPDMTMQDIVDELNTSPWPLYGYRASYDNDTGRIVVTDEDGNTLDVTAASKTHYEETDDGKKRLVIDEELEYKSASQASYTKGQDAIFNVTINGETMQMTRSSNSVNIDGLTIDIKDTFNTVTDDNGVPVKGGDGKYQVAEKTESVSFKTSTDSDKIINVIKDMVNDYNAMMSEIKSAYMTMPGQTSSGKSYEPLTDDEMEGMSESAIARYEEKAKQGLLFADRTLSALYTKMNQAFSFANRADVDTLKDMGITVSYNVSDGDQAVTIDEEKLRAMLDSDPDRVADLFTKTDGVMDRMKTQLDTYGRTTGEPKGILIQQAGSPLSSLSLLNNNWQKEIDNYNKQIEKWQTKLQSQVERYTSQFARLEQLINQMNSQSSTLAGLMGGS